MYFLALAADYDGTIAEHGFVRPETCEALRRLKATGRRLLLVTGREMADLKHAFAELAIFDRVVAENGAVIYDPASGEERAIAPPPPAHFVEKLMERQVEPISVGHAIVATWEPHQATVLAVIQELGLESQIIFNKGAVMVLPSSVNKASGLRAALAELDVSPRNVVAVGDAENDHAFLHLCGCAAAVANALPAIKDEADIRLSGDHGAGVIELIERVIANDARVVPASRNGILVGGDQKGEEVYLEADRNVLIAGESGSGKSTFATLLTERMADRQFEFCIIDPEGDYEQLAHSVSVGNHAAPPVLDEVLKLLGEASINVVVHAGALSLSERPKLLAELLPPIAALRAKSGRPHWLVIDEAHYLLPSGKKTFSPEQLQTLPATIFISINPGALAIEALQTAAVVLAFGSNAPEALSASARALGVAEPTAAPAPGPGEILVWARHSDPAPRTVQLASPRQAHKRHAGKYAVGDVGEWRSFYFRGPRKTLNIRARNVMEFLDVSANIDDSVWLHHLRARDYSAWFRYGHQDNELARQVMKIESNSGLGAQESRQRVAHEVRLRYTIPTECPSSTAENG